MSAVLDDRLTAASVMRYAGISHRQLNYWCVTELVRGYRGVGSGMHRRFDRRDAERIRTASELVRLGLTLDKVRSLVRDRDEAELVVLLRRARDLLADG